MNAFSRSAPPGMWGSDPAKTRRRELPLTESVRRSSIDGWFGELEGPLMNFLRIALAALGGFVAYFVLGALVFGLVPSLKDEFRKYPDVYRTQEGQMSHMPVGMAAMFVAMVVLAVLYAMLYREGFGAVAGARFGALIGVFSICTFVLHNYV